MLTTTTTTTEYQQPTGEKLEAFLLDQLHGHERPDVVQAEMRGKPVDERVFHILETRSEIVQMPPTQAENNVYDELVHMVECTRRREWGAKSQQKLVQTLATYFIPALMAWAPDAEQHR